MHYLLAVNMSVKVACFLYTLSCSGQVQLDLSWRTGQGAVYTPVAGSYAAQTGTARLQQVYCDITA
jgi:hypothetical protein